MGSAKVVGNLVGHVLHAVSGEGWTLLSESLAIGRLTTLSEGRLMVTWLPRESCLWNSGTSRARAAMIRLLAVLPYSVPKCLAANRRSRTSPPC